MKKSKFFAIKSAALLCGLVVFLSAQTSFAQSYSVTQVCSDHYYASALNDNGQVIGSCGSGGAWGGAFMWDNGNITDLSSQYKSLCGTNDTYIYGLGLNNAGIVAGYGWYYAGDPPSSIYTPLLWQGGQASYLNASLNTSDHYRGAEVVGINNQNQIIYHRGMEWSMTHRMEGFMWSNGQEISLGDGFIPKCINDNGQVAGYARSLEFDSTFMTLSGAVWSNGTLTLLGNDRYVNDINNSGLMVGYEGIENHQGTPLMWDNGDVINLNMLPGASLGEASAVNNFGQVVGYSNFYVPQDGSYSEYLATLWQLNGEAWETIDLNTLISSDLGLTLTGAIDVNDKGEILTQAEDENGELVYVLLTPVPELSTFWQMVLAAGVVGLVYLRSYSKRVASHRK